VDFYNSKSSTKEMGMKYFGRLIGFRKKDKSFETLRINHS